MSQLSLDQSASGQVTTLSLRTKLVDVISMKLLNPKGNQQPGRNKKKGKNNCKGGNKTDSDKNDKKQVDKLINKTFERSK